MADFALLAPEGSYHSSVGSCLDALGLVNGQVQRMMAGPDAPPMETRLRIVTAAPGPVTMADGRTITGDATIGDMAAYNLVHIASFRIGGAQALEDRLAAAQPLFAWLRRQRDAGALISASGSALFLLAEAGLLATLATPLPRILIPTARSRFPRLQIDARRTLIDHGGIVLGNGLVNDHALMVRVIEKTISPEIGRWLASVVGYEPAVEGSLAGHPLVADAQLWLEQNFAQEVSVAQLAAAMSTTHQTLIRRFVAELGITPSGYIQRLRAQTAARMLRQTHRSIDQIAALVGYRDTRSFRAMFRKHHGMTATAYRRPKAALPGEGG